MAGTRQRSTVVPVLVITTVATGAQQTISIPEEARAADWVGSHFMLLATGPGTGRLWAVSPTDTALPAPRVVTWPDADSRVGLSFVLGSDLVTYTRFGGQIMMDLRERTPGMPGGAIVIPSAGGAARRIAREIHFATLIPGLDGRSLYAVEAGPLEGPAKPVRLLRLDAQTGKVMTSIVLTDAALSSQRGVRRVVVGVGECARESRAARPTAARRVHTLNLPFYTRRDGGYGGTEPAFGVSQKLFSVPLRLRNSVLATGSYPATATCAGRSTSSPIR